MSILKAFERNETQYQGVELESPISFLTTITIVLNAHCKREYHASFWDYICKSSRDQQRAINVNHFSTFINLYVLIKNIVRYFCSSVYSGQLCMEIVFLFQ